MTFVEMINQYGIIAFVIFICSIVWWASSIKSKIDSAAQDISDLVEAFNKSAESEAKYKLERAEVIKKVYEDMNHLANTLRKETDEKIRQHKSDCK